MAFKKGFVRTRTRGSGTAPVWTGSAVDGFNTVTAGSLQVGTLLTITDGTVDATVRRLRGLITLAATAAPAADQEFWGAVGIMKVSDRAATIGSTAIDRPFTDAGAEWMWHSYFAFTSTFSTGAAFVPIEYHIPIDGKAMRSLDDNEQLVIVLENQSAISVKWTYGVRMLITQAARG